MALRFLLVSLVAGMGLELPSGQDAAAWTHSGREWAGARLADLASIRDEARRAFGGPADIERAEEPKAVDRAEAPEVRDLAFDVVVEGMASCFIADLAASRVEPATETPIEAVVEAPRSADPTPVAWSEPEPAPTDFAQADEPAPAPSRVQRLSSAIRLTRQAARAWASLVDGGTIGVSASN